MGLIDKSMTFSKLELERLDLNKIELTKQELEALGLETSRLKFERSKETGELISFVYRHAKTRELKGVREGFARGKQICVLSKELKATGIIEENVLYSVLMKAMHGGKKGFVVVSATPILFKARIETSIVPKAIYQVSVSFGNKVIYFDPKDGKSHYSRTLEGVLGVLAARHDIEHKEQIIEDFRMQAEIVIRRLEADGYILPSR